MLLNHNQLNTVLPSGDFAPEPDPLTAAGNLGSFVLPQYVGTRRYDFGDGTIGGENVDAVEVPNDHVVMPPFAPHVRDPQPRDPEEVRRGLDRITEQVTGKTAAERRAEMDQELRDGDGSIDR